MLDYFTGRTDGDAISLEWKSTVENGVKTYTVERSDLKSNEFQELTKIAATGNYSTYHFQDTKVMIANPLGGQNTKSPLSELYKYRLKLTFPNEVSYSQTISVTKPTSGVRRTWGMIKEMFH